MSGKKTKKQYPQKPATSRPSAQAAGPTPPRRNPPRSSNAVLYSRLVLAFVFFSSGLCGLLYEVVWTRLLVLVFGSTTHAIATVLAVFMLGLTLGSHIFGRLVNRLRSPQRVYGLLEIGIGIYAFLFLPLLYMVQYLHSAGFPWLYDKPALLSIFRIVLSLSIILLPTLLMGATIPLVTSILTRSEGTVGRDVGVIYFLNTIGASLGSFLSAFVIIPSVGLHWTLFLGGFLNLAIGAITILIRQAPLTLETAEEESASVPAGERSQHVLALIAFCVVGFLSMIYENAWSRALVMVFGTSIYAFATMLTTYLFGLAMGSLVIGFFVDRIKNHMAWFAALTAIVGFSIFATTPLIGNLPDYFLHVFSKDDAGWGLITLMEFLVSFLIMLPATFCSGASFPLVSRISAQMRGFQIGRSVADVYALNTAGCILGSLATGFLIIPWMGVEKSLLSAGSASILLAAILLAFPLRIGTLRQRAVRTATASALAIAAVAGLWLIPGWDHRVMTSGVYIYSRPIAKQGTVEDFMARYQLLFYKEGASDTVSVLESPSGTRFLRVNGKTDGSDGGDKYTQVLLGLLPVIYSRDPQYVLNIGLGTGITAGSLLDYPLASIECVEISPAVVEASQFFSKSNGDVLKAPRFQLHVLDGRTWLMAMDRKYDMIISEPSHPWQTGNANLFTTEFFELAKSGLNEDGILCQWLPYYHMDKEHFRVLLKSLKTVFRHLNVWIDNTDAIVIASNQPLVLDYAQISKKLELEGFKSRLETIGVQSVEDLLSFFYIDDDSIDDFIESGKELNSDMFPIVEFNAPKYVSGKVRPDTFFQLMELSYRSRLNLTNCENPEEINRKRIEHRAKYFREWFPDSVSSEIIRKSLQGLHEISSAR